MAGEMRDSPAESAAKPSGGDRPPDSGTPTRAISQPDYVEQLSKLVDGTEVLIRPILEADCSACSTMLTACSQESLYSRYERVVTESPDRLASELCNPDPICERTLVGEIRHGTFPTVIGLAQLLTDPAHTVAEYAVLIADPWQNKGLGSAFTDVCLKLANVWRVPRIVAEFLPSNMRMIRILEKRHFAMSRNLQEHFVSGEKLVGLDDVNAPLRCRPSAEFSSDDAKDTGKAT